MDLLDAALANLLSPPILSFVLGVAAGAARSDLDIPDPIAKAMAIYLIFSIGLKGGVALAEGGELGALLPALLAGAALSFALPLLAFAFLRASSSLSRVDAAATSAHYGSVSVVTFVTAAQFVQLAGLPAEGFMPAVVAVMETPAIVTGLLLARRFEGGAAGGHAGLWREALLNGSVVLLVGSFLIGLATGTTGLERVGGFFVAPFQGVLCLFLLEMGLVVARRLRGSRGLTPALIAFGLYMPPIAATFGLATGWAIGLSTGGTAILATLAASASYIAVPAAMRLALPRADPAVSLTLALAITFPFNVIVGIPLYVQAARWLGGG
jgi:hypothetical protein